MTENKIRSFTDLNAWKEGHKLVLMIYRTTEHFPGREMFALINQMRRCVISITSNIAEGFSRGTNNDKCQFYTTAQGSLTELQNQLLIARDIGYIRQEEFQTLANQTITTNKLLNGLKRIRNTSYKIQDTQQ
ncbi:MAG: four helix bundle protein [Candidatus Wildermuthbacteria bacterium]|nr:four helix bundle protein [Candidatus Wildermuthbacteria bacterium]